jgi:hypothetical protein
MLLLSSRKGGLVEVRMLFKVACGLGIETERGGVTHTVTCGLRERKGQKSSVPLLQQDKEINPSVPLLPGAHYHTLLSSSHFFRSSSVE